MRARIPFATTAEGGKKLEVDLESTLYQVRAMLWANALQLSSRSEPNQGVSIRQLGPEAASLRARVEARLTLVPPAEALAVRDLLPLPALRANPTTIPTLAALVRAGAVTLDEIERYMVTSEYSAGAWREPRPQPRPRPRRRPQLAAAS